MTLEGPCFYLVIGIFDGLEVPIQHAEALCRALPAAHSVGLHGRDKSHVGATEEAHDETHERGQQQVQAVGLRLGVESHRGRVQPHHVGEHQLNEVRDL